MKVDIGYETTSSNGSHMILIDLLRVVQILDGCR